MTAGVYPVRSGRLSRAVRCENRIATTFARPAANSDRAAIEFVGDLVQTLQSLVDQYRS